MILLSRKTDRIVLNVDPIWDALDERRKPCRFFQFSPLHNLVAGFEDFKGKPEVLIQQTGPERAP
jgi:hypothetical protein